MGSRLAVQSREIVPWGPDTWIVPVIVSPLSVPEYLAVAPLLRVMEKSMELPVKVPPSKRLSPLGVLTVPESDPDLS
jgi:hypothetical protein